MRLTKTIFRLLLAGGMSLLTACSQSSPAQNPSSVLEQARTSAESYADATISRQSLLDVLSKDQGLDKQAAEQAVDELDLDYNANALKMAEAASQSFASKAAIRDELIQDGQYTEAEADWALDHLEVDYNASALQSARNLEGMFSGEDLYEVLCKPLSEDGLGFTREQARYALDQLDESD